MKAINIILAIMTALGCIGAISAKDDTGHAIGFFIMVFSSLLFLIMSSEQENKEV